MPLPSVADPRQAQLHGVAPQAQDVHHFPVPHLEQVLRRALANSAMIGSHGGQPHPLIAAVNQHAGLADIDGQIVNMRIVDTEQDRRLGIRFIHTRQEKLRVAVVLLQRAVAEPDFM
ncbi:hypothetical protein D3C71_1730370 [compost metagenome]